MNGKNVNVSDQTGLPEMNLKNDHPDVLSDGFAAASGSSTRHPLGIGGFARVGSFEECPNL